jgi:hypothetical protein
MTNSVKVTAHTAHSLIRVYDTNHGPSESSKLIREVVVEPGESMDVNVWLGREITISEIRNDHPAITGVAQPAQPMEAEAA